MAKDCKDTALAHLEHRERSAAEMIKHLKEKGFDEKQINETINFLKSFHYIDDELYCQHYLEYGIRRGKGPIRIQLELKEKGIETQLIQNTIEEYFDSKTERQAAASQVNKLLGFSEKTYEDDFECDNEEDFEGDYNKKIPDEKTIGKVGRKLSNLGYHSDVIYEIIGQLRKGNQRI